MFLLSEGIATHKKKVKKNDLGAKLPHNYQLDKSTSF
jgi:hypothetical protein